MSSSTPTATPPSAPGLPSAGNAALAGIAAGLVAIAAGELFAGLVAGAPSIVVTVGDLVIALQPPGAKELVVELFGGNHKVALQLVIVVAALAIAAGAGVLARRRFERGAWVFVLAGGFALVVSLAAAGGLAEPILVLAAVGIAVGAGLVALRWLLGIASRAAAAPPEEDAEQTAGAWARRRFLIASAATLGGAASSGRSVAALVERRAVEEVVHRLEAARRRSSRLRRLAPDQVLAVDGAHAARRPDDPVLPDRHRARSSRGSTSRAGASRSSAWSTGRSTFTYDDLLGCRSSSST